MLKPQEIRDLSENEIELMYTDYVHELYEMINHSKIERPEKPHLIRQKRKDIALLLTILNEKKRVLKRG